MVTKGQKRLQSILLLKWDKFLVVTKFFFRANLYHRHHCLLCQGPSAEVELKTGGKIRLTTNKEYIEKCSASVLHLDYMNITKVVKPGNRVFVDDGLISLIANEIGE